jgi:tripartite-type tricarboxylate transporter receptor subunit TctC
MNPNAMPCGSETFSAPWAINAKAGVKRMPNAAPPHLLAAWFKALTGTDVVIVPYKGASAVLTDLLGGQIQAGFETTSVLFSHLQDKKINALAVATQVRLPDLPEVPTMIESGRGFIASSAAKR